MERRDTISPRLTLERFSSRYPIGLAHVALFVTVVVIPLTVYFLFLSQVLATGFFLVIYIPFMIRIAMLVLGNEKKRWLDYRSQIVKLHNDGSIEFADGTSAYFLIENSFTQNKDKAAAEAVIELLKDLSKNYSVGIYTRDRSASAIFAGRYSGIELIDKGEAFEVYTNLLKHNQRSLKESTLYEPMVYTVKSKSSGSKIIKNAVEVQLRKSQQPKQVLNIASKAMVEAILEINDMTDIRLNGKDSVKGDYCSSNAEERGFMIHLE